MNWKTCFVNLLLGTAVLVVPPAAGISVAQPAAERPMPARMEVDFLNRDAQSVSMSIGRLHGVTTGMNFAVLDSDGVEIGRFYPDELMPERLWSSPLPKAAFARIAVGQQVVRLSLDPQDSAALRESGRRLKAELAMAKKRDQLAELQEELEDLEEEISDLKVDGVRLSRSREEIQADIQRGRLSIEPKVQEYDRQTAEIRADWNPLEEERRDLLERRDRILRRSSPSQRELDRINEDLADLDRKVAPLRDRFNILWAERQKLLESVDTRLSDRLLRVQQEEAENNAEIRELEIEKADIQREIRQLEREVGGK